LTTKRPCDKINIPQKPLSGLSHEQNQGSRNYIFPRLGIFFTSCRVE
jgi:hypothetical protein